LNSRIYLDYNSTSPLAKSVIDFLAKGDFSFQNPASIHQGGKSALKIQNDIRAKLYETFSLDESKYNLVFHSGATEFISTFFQFDSDDLYVYSPADHKAALEQAYKANHTHEMSLNHHGNTDFSELLEAIKAHKIKFPLSQVLINYTWVHNETGVIWPLSEIEKLKSDNVYIHVDAVQSVGKVSDWTDLKYGDVFTYSAHKFGALKGIGFSFIKMDTPFKALIRGGNQQNKLRAGTENVLAQQSIAFALSEVSYSEELEEFKKDIEKMIQAHSRFEIIGLNSQFGRNNNTINFIDKNQKADLNLIKFDMQGLDISSGSACTAGSVEASHTLLSYGYHEHAKNGLRISLGVDSLNFKDEIIKRLQSILNI